VSASVREEGPFVLRRVALAAVDHGLRALWADAAGAANAGEHATRLATLNLVALCETEAHAARAIPALEAAARTHGARTFLVTWGPPVADEEASISAQIALHARLGDATSPVAEAVRLHARGEARAWLPDAIGKLLAPDLPVAAWWVGDLPDHDELFDRVAEGADLCVFDSGEMDLRDLPRLSALTARAERSSRGFAVADFSWLRLASWQELMARFFDPPECTSVLGAIDRIVLRFQPRATAPEPISNAAALFAGWLCARLGWSLERFERSELGGAVEARLRAGEGAGPRLVFEPLARGGTPAGGLQEVVVESGSIRFHVERSEDDPCVLCWSSSGASYEVAPQCVRLEESLARDEARTLPRLLTRPIRDPNLEESLHLAATLVAPIAPGAPGAPQGA
jgi:glucose-6-phosphate dehydrogenase assembly protein OpcA